MQGSFRLTLEKHGQQRSHPEGNQSDRMSFFFVFGVSRLLGGTTFLLNLAFAIDDTSEAALRRRLTLGM